MNAKSTRSVMAIFNVQILSAVLRVVVLTGLKLLEPCAVILTNVLRKISALKLLNAQILMDLTAVSAILVMKGTFVR